MQKVGQAASVAETNLKAATATRMEAKRIVRENVILVWAQINLWRREEDARLPHTVLYVGELSPSGIHLASLFRLIYLRSTADSQLPCEARSIAIWRGTKYHLPKQAQ